MNVAAVASRRPPRTRCSAPRSLRLSRDLVVRFSQTIISSESTIYFCPLLQSHSIPPVPSHDDTTEPVQVPANLLVHSESRCLRPPAFLFYPIVRLLRPLFALVSACLSFCVFLRSRPTTTTPSPYTYVLRRWPPLCCALLRPRIYVPPLLNRTCAVLDRRWCCTLQ
ncbi:hypothetical protein FKP32DRAFT_462395 [Trametes sanguinea]|nr:hypothetical protein FKP32DRAFT_462395 [Trametes sanguinea]